MISVDVGKSWRKVWTLESVEPVGCVQNGLMQRAEPGESGAALAELAARGVLRPGKSGLPRGDV